MAPAEHSGVGFQIELAKIGGKGVKLKTQKDFEKILGALGVDTAELKYSTSKRGGLVSELKAPLHFELMDCVMKESSRIPGAPFTTSTLQQEASRKL